MIGERHLEVSLSMTTLFQICWKRFVQASLMMLIYSLRPLSKSVFVSESWSSAKFTQFSLGIMVSFVGSPFRGGARQTVLPPSVGFFRGCICETRVWNRHHFFLIVLKAEFSSRRTKFSASSYDSFSTLCSNSFGCFSFISFKV